MDRACRKIVDLAIEKQGPLWEDTKTEKKSFGLDLEWEPGYKKENIALKLEKVLKADLARTVPFTYGKRKKWVIWARTLGEETIKKNQQQQQGYETISHGQDIKSLPHQKQRQKLEGEGHR